MRDSHTQYVWRYIMQQRVDSEGFDTNFKTNRNRDTAIIKTKILSSTFIKFIIFYSKHINHGKISFSIKQLSNNQHILGHILNFSAKLNREY